MAHPPRILFVIAALLAGSTSPVPAFAQEPAGPGGAALQRSGVIHGVVVNAETRAPIAAASVRLLELGRSELSHADGSFHFDRLSPGSYRVVVQRIGFAPAERVVRVSAGATTDVQVDLTPSAVTIPGLVVTGIGRARSAAEIYRPASVLDDAELRRQLGSSIAATIAHEPGLSQRYNGPAAAQPVIRGLGGDRVLVLEDGQRTGDIASTAADHAVTVEPLTAERIEVLRGPAGLLYGSNALGGVINVIREEVPRTLPESLSGMVTAQAESVNQGLTAGGSAIGAVGHLVFRGELSGRRAGDTRTPLGPLPSTQLTGYNAGLGASWVGENSFFGLAGRDYGMDYGVPGTFNGVVIPGAHEDGVSIDLRRSALRAEAGYFSPVGPFSALEWDAQYVRFHQDEIEQGGVIGTSFGQLTATSKLKAHHRHSAGELLTDGTVGLSALWQDLRVGGAAGSAPADQVSLAAFAFEELEWNRFRLQGGGRLDWTRITPLERHSLILGDLRTRDFAAFSGSIATLYEPRDGMVLGASLSRAFRNPSITELFSEGPHLADYSFNIGNPHLQAEHGLGVDLFARAHLPRLSGELAAYRNTLDNYIHYAPTGELDPRLGRFPLYQARADRAVLHGAEGRVQWEIINRLVLDGNAAYVHALRAGDRAPLPAIPPAHGGLLARYDATRYFASAGWEGGRRQDRVSEFERPTPGYSLWNAAIGWRWTVQGNFHTITLQARNLLDDVWYDHLSRIREVAPQPGRSIVLLYRATF